VEAVRGRLMQMLVSSLGDKEGGVLQAAAAANRQRPLEKAASSAGGKRARKGGKVKGGKAAAAARAKPKARDAQPALPLRRAQECELCGLFFSSMAKSLEETKAGMALSKAAAMRRQAQIEGMQKAQTRRWLKAEYGQNLAAALEEVVDGLCASDSLVDTACASEAAKGKAAAWRGEPALRRPDERPFKRATCALRVKARCSTLVDEAADAMQRSALDGHDASACAALLRGCSVGAAMAYNSTHWERGAEAAGGTKDEV